METVSDKFCLEDDLEFDYLLLPSIAIEETPYVDWITINSIHPTIVKCLHHEANIWTEKDVSKTFVNLPYELCSIIMSPISVRTLYSFSFIPSIMHRLESLLLVALNFKKIHLNHCPRKEQSSGGNSTKVLLTSEKEKHRINIRLQIMNV
ncbi:dicer-like protein, putative [Medicago truncatula]|uniref:Dicer-like protein, putative n=1 Tax=Medicago truncatula TaxID=3880 RepID=A0A072VK62_MEDTR|nr:dicer-like protein, putative [Medicago truncatula]